MGQSLETMQASHATHLAGTLPKPLTLTFTVYGGRRHTTQQQQHAMDLYSHIQVPKRVINMHEKHHACLKSFGADSGGIFDCLCFWALGGSARYPGESARYPGESARYLSESARYLGESAR